MGEKRLLRSFEAIKLTEVIAGMFLGKKFERRHEISICKVTTSIPKENNEIHIESKA